MHKIWSKSLLFALGFVFSYSIVGGCGGYYRPVSPATEQPPASPKSAGPDKQAPANSAVTRPVSNAGAPQVKKPVGGASSATTTSAGQGAPQAPSSAASRQGGYLAYPAMQQFIQRMTQKGFSRNELERLFSGVSRDDVILAKVARPAEAKPWRLYRPIFLTEERIRSGVGFWNVHQAALDAASRRFGVEPEYIVAIIGVETFYGRNLGNHGVLRSLTTLAMDFPQRSDFYTGELEQFLRLTREENIPNPHTIKGSYAGAMGLGQFISSSYRNFAVDMNNDKHRDLWNPDDAIGSVANYFSRHGWKQGSGVTVPARISGENYAKIAHTQAVKPLFSLSQLKQYGVEPVAKIDSTRVDLLRLQGSQGNEYWVTGDNFYTITRYNHSPKYAMAVFQLAQEIKRRKQGLK